MFHMKRTRNPGNLLDPGVIPIQANRIPVLQAPRDSASNVENPTTKSTKKNAEPRMATVISVTK